MAKEFTHRQSIESLISATLAQANGKPEAEVNELALDAIDTILNSNSLDIADAQDQKIALQDLLDAARNHLNNPVIQQALPEVIEVMALPEPEDNS